MIPGLTAPRALAGAVAALLLVAAPAGAETFGPTAPVPITATGSSNLPVSGLSGGITDVNVLLHDIDHTRAQDIDILVQSPTGGRLVLMSDACNPGPISNTSLKFDQVATQALPNGEACGSGIYDPSDYTTAPPDAWTVNPFYGSLDDFNGEVPNGTWSIEVIDDTAGETGDISGGWSLEIETSGTPAITISTGSQAVGPASPFPAELEVLDDEQVVVTDVDVLLNGVTHQMGRHIDMFLEGPGGQKAWLMSDVCGADNKLADWKVDDEAPNPFPDAESCSSNTYRPRDFDEDPTDLDTFSAPAPAPPGSETLSAFDLTDPDGVWKLWIQDDSEGGQGFVRGGWTLELDTRPAAPVGFAVGAQTVREGDTLVVDVVRDASAGALGAGSIVVATQSDTAAAGKDFTPVSQTVAFGPGETTKSIAVPVTADGPFEPEESFSIALGLSEGDARVGTPAAVAVTIPADAQQPPPTEPAPGTERKPAPKTFSNTNAITGPSRRRCFRRGARIQFRPKMPEGVAIVRSEVFVNGRKIEDNIGGAAVAPINLTMSGKRIRVRIRLTAHDGRVVSLTRTFRRCKPRRR